MSTIAVVASEQTFVASLGAMLDAYARMGEAFAMNREMGDYAGVHTRLALVAAKGNGDILLCGSRRLKPDAGLGDLDDVRVVYLPAFQEADPDQLRQSVAESARLHAWLGEQAGRGAIIGAAGESVWHLAAAGLLDGRECAVHPRQVSAFRKAFPRIAINPLAGVAVSGSILTCGAAMHAPLLVARVLAEAFGMQVGRAIAVREPPGEGFDGAIDDGDPVVARARQWIRDHYAGDFRIADLAIELGVSHQSLIRRFRQAGAGTPRGFAQECRVESASSMLAETARSVKEIAALVGYSDMTSFRNVFRAATGLSPGAWRRARREERHARSAAT